MQRIKVLVVEGQERLRHAYTATLSAEPTIGLIGNGNGGYLEADDIEGITKALAKADPHILLLGTEVIDEAALHLLETVCGRFPEIGIVLLGQRYQPSVTSRLRSLAARQTRGAYLLKSSLRRATDLISIIDDVMRGQVIIDREVLAGLVREEPSSRQRLDQMTGVELDVLTWLAMGYRNNAIAAMLRLEPRAADQLIAGVFGKLADRDPACMHPGVAVALSHLANQGLIEPPSLHTAY